MLNGTILRSPDHPGLDPQAKRGTHWQVPRSCGFEGVMVADGTLWALLDAPICDPTGESKEAFAQRLEFDTAARAWTGRTAKLQLPPGAIALGDINAIGPNRVVVLARDGN